MKNTYLNMLQVEQVSSVPIQPANVLPIAPEHCTRLVPGWCLYTETAMRIASTDVKTWENVSCK